MTNKEIANLLKLDKMYFTTNIPKNLAYGLATYCFDSDFGIDDNSWKLFINIEKIFGKVIARKVLYNLFNRNHDT